MNKIKSKYCRAALAAGLALAAPTFHAADSPSALETARQLNEAFIQATERASRAVVVVEVAHRPDYDENEDNDNPLLDMLPPELRRHPRRKSGVYDGRGSGIVLREDGWILTNHHVVDGAEKVRVKFNDGRIFAAEGEWRSDPQSDIAVIKIDARGLVAAKLADSAKTRVGEFAIAIGAPFELDYSVTFGHVSAKGRTHVLDNSMDQDFIQTDASINPGNSGGPLVNIEGEVIGVNTIIRGMNRGIGFAIPSNLARQVADHLIADGKFTRAWLGIQIRALKEYVDFRDLIPGVDEGVVVRRIVPNGPAFQSGLKPADVITAVGGVPVSTAQQLRNEVRARGVGTEVPLDVVRLTSTGSAKNLRIRLRTEEWPEENIAVARPTPKAETNAWNGFGLTVQALDQGMAQKYGIELVPGVVVTAVDPVSPAAQQWIRPGDIITQVDLNPVVSVKHFKELLKATSGKRVLLHLLSDGAAEFKILKDSGD